MIYFYGTKQNNNLYRNLSDTEQYSSGWRGAPAKGIGRETGARVQISPAPPLKKSKHFI